MNKAIFVAASLGVGIGVVGSAVLGANRTQAETRQEGPGATLGSAIPAVPPDYIIADLMAVDGDAVPHRGAMLYVSRATVNRLRDSLGGSQACDGPGLQLDVLAGASASRWGIASGSVVNLTCIQSGLPVPMELVAGDDWFGTGIRLQVEPCK